MQQNTIHSADLKNARKKNNHSKSLPLLWGSIKNNYLPSLGSAGDPPNTGTHIFLWKTNISAGFDPDALQVQA